jgi:hypothetical protein
MLSLLRGPASGQVLNGSIVGNVTDSSSAAVGGAIVRALHLETNRARQLATNDAGGYTFSDIPVGTYDVTVTKEGFQTFASRRIRVEVNSVVRVDATLQVGAITQSVEVSTESAVLQADRSDVHSEVLTHTIESVPVAGRSYQSLFFLVPGVTQPDYFQTGGINNPSRAMTVNVNGTPNTDVVVRVDGVSATNQWIQNLQAYTPAMEAIQTVNVVTSSFDAEQGLAGGASVTVQIKSGTNQVHGSAFEYNSNTALRARGFFLPSTSPKPPANKNMFGGTVGGPIKRDKLFYFVSYEGFIDHETGGPYALATGSYLTLPDALVRSGNMSASSNPIYDPMTGSANGTGRTPFPDKIVPLARQDPIVTGYFLPKLPLPQFAGSSNNYFTVPPYQSNYHKIDTKVNWNATNKLSVTGRFSYLPDTESSQGNYGPAVNPLSLPLEGTAGVISTTAAATYILTPNFVVDGLVGFTRQHTQQHPGGPNQCWGAQANIPNACYAGSRDYALTKMIFSGGWTSLGGSPSFYDYMDPQYEWTANAGWIKGRHNVRFGVDLLKLDMNHYEIPYLPGFTFTGGLTALNGGPAPNQYNAFADFLLGLPQSLQDGFDNPPLNGRANPDRPVTLRSREIGLYIRDQFQVSRKLTASIGLRWEYYPVPTRADRGIELFDFSTNKQLICGEGGIPENCGIHVNPWQFAPRVGVAYRPAENFVIRAGFSLNWQQDNMYRSGLYSYPTQVAILQSGLTSYSAVGTIAQGFPALTTPNVSTGTISLPAGASTTTLPKNFVRGYVMSWNFTLQKSMGHGFTAQAGYVATRALHQAQNQNVNYGLPGGGAASQPFYQSLGITGSLNVIWPMVHTYYDSLQASLNRRFSAGLSLNAAFTWSKNISNFAGSIPIPQYFNRNRGLAQIDIPAKFTLAATQELPFGKGKRLLNHGGLASALAGGWQVNAILAAYSGSPFTISASTTSLNAPGSPQLADQVKPDVQVLGGVGSNTPYFDPLAFASVTQVRFGTAGFNTLRGPAVANLDLSLFREFNYRERIKLQLRAEAFNVTNTPHFWSPGTRGSNYSPVFTDNVSNMVLNSDGTVRSLNGYDSITTVNATGRDYDERYFRLGLRISF